MKFKKAFLLLILAIIFLVMVIGFYSGSMQNLSDTTSRYIAIGRWMGIFTTFAILIELLLMSRAPIIENNFDIEEISAVHKYNGFVILYSLFGHILFLTIGYGQFFDTGLISQFINLNTDFDYVLQATIGSLMFILISLTSLKLIRHRVKYEIWYYLHLIVYVAIALTFLHQINSGADFITQSWFKLFWIVLYGVVFGLLLYYRFLRQLVYIIKYDFKVDKVVQEAKSVYSIYITGKNLKSFKYSNGQYATWRFLSKNYWYEAHPYSFSSSYGNRYLRITIKTSGGDFSKKLIDAKTGTRVFVDGPRGAFTYKRPFNDNVLLAAGGVGVAPIMSMLDKIAQNHKNVILLYCFSNISEMAFRNEIDAISKSKSNIIIIPYETSKLGHINQDYLKQIVGSNSKNVSAMICGPARMIDNIKGQLIKIGLSSSQIFSEKFKF